MPQTGTVKIINSSSKAHQNVQKKLAGLIINHHVLWKKKKKAWYHLILVNLNIQTVG